MGEFKNGGREWQPKGRPEAVNVHDFLSQGVGKAIPCGTAPFRGAAPKWNRIEHRMFAHLSMNWRGRPLTSHEAVVELIGATTTRQGLRIHAELDPGTYPIGLQASDAEFGGVPLNRHAFHGECRRGRMNGTVILAWALSGGGRASTRPSATCGAACEWPSRSGRSTGRPSAP